jgi:hypothetical protein
VQQSRTLIVNGQSGEVKVMEIDGRSYVDLESLAHIANGTLGFSGNQITLTLPSSPPAQRPRPHRQDRLPIPDSRKSSCGPASKKWP